MQARAYYKGHVGRSHRGRVRREDGPKGSSYTTKPLSFIRWISCGRIEANCHPKTCVNSAIDARTLRRNSETINSWVGSAMGRVPLEAAWRATVVIGVPIIQVFEREREKIHRMGRGTRKDTSSHIPHPFPWGSEGFLSSGLTYTWTGHREPLQNVSLRSFLTS